MRIIAVRTTAVRVPIRRIAAFARRNITAVDNTIVEIEVEGGLIGLGEVREHYAKTVIDERFASAIVGIDAYDMRAVRDACLPKEPFDYGYPELPMYRSAFSAIEMALWDIGARAAAQPLFRYLGGKVREKAPFVAYAYSTDPAEGHGDSRIADIMAGIAAERVAATGADMFEFKVGLHSPACEIGVVSAVREALGPDVAIAVDCNCGFSFDQAQAFLRGASRFGLANCEEPVASLAGTERLRNTFGVPVSTHCTDLNALMRFPGIDAVVTDPGPVGGIRPLIGMASTVEAIGKEFWLRARWELGVAWALFCHLGVSVPQLRRPSQALIDWVEDDVVLGETWLVRDGGVCPPDLPGLGVELDRQALARYAI